MTPAAAMEQIPEQNRDLPISVVILSYNYADFVGAAIDSALSLEWHRVEVIVVDDGSTDNSRDIISSYGDRVTTVFKENGGHLSAYAAGFAKTSGEVVIFLDSDDVLTPSIIKELARVWRPGLSKVQFQMQIINREGVLQNRYLPQFFTEPSAQDIRKWAIASSTYPTPPGSGNAYSRAFLLKILPVPPWFNDDSGDSACISAAALLGDIITVPKPLVAYRVHGRNQGAMMDLDIPRIIREVKRAHNRFAYSERLAGSFGVPFSSDALSKSLAILPYRTAAWRFGGYQHPYFGDNGYRLIRDAVRAALTPQGAGPKASLTLVAWTILVVLAPKGLARRLAAWRFVSASRPEGITKLLRRIGVVR